MNLDKIIAKFGKSSWQTTVAGIVLLINVLTGEVMEGLSEGLSAVDFSVIITAGATAFGLIMARDNNKSSEAVGVKKKK